MDNAPSFGRYKVTSTLGSGAMGHVYAAVDEVLGRPVAVKTLRNEHSGAAARMFDERFRLEARAVAALNHPAIVQVYDLDLAANPPFLVMERMAGPSLSETIKAGPLAHGELRALGIQIARALAAAHAAGIVHRDVKPANILGGGPGVWKLADFGVAHVPDSSLTMTGQFIGSPAYAPPEALIRGESTAAGDVFGLGATLYYAAAGTWPRARAETSALLAPIPSVRTLAPSLPDDLVATIDRAVELEPARRPNAVQLAEALASAASPPPPPSEPPRLTGEATAVLPTSPNATSTATEVLPPARTASPATEVLPPAPATNTAFVPDATNAPAPNTAFVPGAVRATASSTAFVPDATNTPAPAASRQPRWRPWAALATAVAALVVVVIVATRGDAKPTTTSATLPVREDLEDPAHVQATDDPSADPRSPASLEPPGAPEAPEPPEPPGPASARPNSRTITIRRPQVTDPGARQEFEGVIDEIYKKRYTYALDRLDEWERRWGATTETITLRDQLEVRAGPDD